MSIADRRFVYDANERLCKTSDPEAGWTVMDYDASNNLAWTTTGSSLTDCQCANVAAGDKSSRNYDGRNRLMRPADLRPVAQRRRYPPRLSR